MVYWADLKAKPDAELIRFLGDNINPLNLEQAVRFLAAMYYLLSRRREVAPVSPIGCKRMRTFAVALSLLGGSILPKRIEHYIAEHAEADGGKFRVELSELTAWQNALLEAMDEPTRLGSNGPGAKFRSKREPEAPAAEEAAQEPTEVPVEVPAETPTGRRKVSSPEVLQMSFAVNREGIDPKRLSKKQKMAGGVNRAGMPVQNTPEFLAQKRRHHHGSFAGTVEEDTRVG